MIKKNILKSLVMCMIITSFIFLFYTESINADTIGTVTTSKLNVRRGPSTSYKKIGSLSKNNSVYVIGSSNGWYKIKLSNNSEGWITSQYIKLTSTQSNVVNTDTNSTSHSVNKKINVVWYKIKLSNNSEGWITSQYIKLTSTQSNVVNTDTNSTSHSVNKKINVVATAYTGYSTTSTGQKPVWGTIAVDPKVIPYGTKVYIPQFDRVFVANNTGGAIKGNKIDIFMNTKSECYNWGRRSIEIHVLN